MDDPNIPFSNADIPGNPISPFTSPGVDGSRRREIWAPGGGICVTLVNGGGGDGRRDRYDDGYGPGWRDGRGREPINPAQLPMSGSEIIHILQNQTLTVGNFFREAAVSALQFIRSFFPASWSWRSQSINGGVNLTTLFQVPPLDMMYMLQFAAQCTNPDVSTPAQTATLTINYTTPGAGGQHPTQQFSLTVASALVPPVAIPVLLQGSTIVSFEVTSAQFGAATYDLIISCIPMSSDMPVNNPSNMML